ncbi:hypothetical protein BD408DRAFT_412729 [Parasitella parasitica]|nr:hypothetical protein BD408DRAFT_412729 [Parasitella parasitica]
MEEYIIENYQDFDPIICFNSMKYQTTRGLAEAEFESVINNLRNNEDLSVRLIKWCKNVVENDFNVIKTNEALVYWELKTKAREEITKSLNKAEESLSKRELIEIEKKNVLKTVRDKMTLVNKLKRKAETIEAASQEEQDPVLFGSKSVGTILKNAGENESKRFWSLNKKEQYMISLCLNSILDLSDERESSQKLLFTDEEWKLIAGQYGRKFFFNRKKMEQKTKEVNKHLRQGDLDRAYTVSRKLELDNLNGPDEALYFIYSHIVNLYRKRRDVLNPKSKKTPTEYNYITKIWVNILEALFPEDKIYIKWGESHSAACKDDYKVDARIIVQVNGEVNNLSNMEASRQLTNQKIDEDHLKLIIESKCALDNIIMKTSSLVEENLNVLFIQLSGAQCEVNILSLLAPGLYVVNQYCNLNITNSLPEFADNASKWFASLFAIKESLYKLSSLVEVNTPKSATYNEHFRRHTHTDNFSYAEWIRSTFYPPNEDNTSFSLPQHLYDAPTAQSRKTTKH